MKKCPVFICYRQVDGTKIAQWLFENLDGQRLPDIGHVATEEEVSSLDVYFDQRAPAVSDWKAIHQPRLRTSQAMIIVCTPGSFQKLEKNDWVHLEIDWWLKNRKVAPILIDATGEGERWVPKVIKDRWPDAQRITVVQDDLLRLQGKELRLFEEQVRSRILNGIVLSKQRVVFEDLERQKRMSRRLSIALVVAGIFLLSTILAFVLTMRAWDSAKEAKAEAERQAEAADAGRTEAEEERKKAVAAEGEAKARADEAQKARAEAERQRQIAEQQYRLTLSRQLVGQATNLLETQFDQALLLSLEACRAYDSSETRLNLLRALQENPHLTAMMRFGPAHDVPSGAKAGRPLGLAFSPDGQILASVSEVSRGNSVLLWDVASHQLIDELVGHQDFVTSVAFSPDGKTLASGSYDDTIILWDIVTRQPNDMLVGHQEGVTSVAFSPDGKTLASGSYDDTIILWNTATHQAIGSPLKGHNSGITCIAFTADSTVLVSADVNFAGVLFWDVSEQRLIEKFSMDHYDGLEDMAFSPEDATLASIDGKSGVILLDVLNRGQSVRLSEGRVGNWGNALAFSPGGEFLAWTSEEHVVLFDTAAKEPLDVQLQGHSEEVESLAFSPDGRVLASLGWDNTIIFWSIDKPRSLRSPSDIEFEMPGAQPTDAQDLMFSPDGEYLALYMSTWLSGAEDQLRLWKVATRKLLYSDSLDVYAVAFSPDSKTLAVSSADVPLMFLDTVTAEESIEQVTKEIDDITCLHFKPNSNIIALGEKNGAVFLWNTQTDQLIEKHVPERQAELADLTFSPDGKILVSVSCEGVLSQWDLTAGDVPGSSFQLFEVSRPDLRDDRERLHFHPSGKYLAVAGCERYTIWNIIDHRPLVRLGTGSAFGSAICGKFSQDGNFFVWSRYPDGIRILGDEGRQDLVVPLLEAGNVTCIAFHPDGKTLASCTKTHDNDAYTTISFWDFDIESWKERASKIANRNFSLGEWQQYLPDEPYGKTCPNLPIHTSFIEAGRDLARAGDIKGAVTIFRRAIELEPSLDLDPEEEAQRLAPRSDD